MTTGMNVTGRLELIALDATDIVGLASFYAELTGWQTVRNVDGWITLRAQAVQHGGGVIGEQLPGRVGRIPRPAGSSSTVLVSRSSVAMC